VQSKFETFSRAADSFRGARANLCLAHLRARSPKERAVANR
jgi:hypothetical protein